jgi:hypothetical protein
MKIITSLKHVRLMRLKINNLVMYLYNSLAKRLNEITFTQNISLLFKHQ